MKNDSNRHGMYVRLLLLIILSVQSVAIDFAATYYIRPGGNDASDGLSTITAWQSIAKVNASFFSAGDKILFESGSTFTGNIYLNSGSAGTIAKPILISSYGFGRATINAGNSHGLLAYNTAGIEVKNLIFTGSGYTTNSGTGVYFFMDLTNNTKLKYIVMENLEVSGFKTSGIQVASWPTDGSRSGFDTVIIQNCNAHDNGLSGMSMSGYYSVTDSLYSHRHLLVSGCKTYNNFGLTGHSTHSGSGIIIGQVDTGVIEYCEAYENGKNNNFAGGGPAGIWAWDSKNVVIQYCYSHHNRSQTLDGDGFDLDGGVKNSIMQYNYAHDNDGPGFLVAQYKGARKMKNIAVRYNISERDGRGLGALIWSGDTAGNVTAQKIDFYNNTIYTDTTGGGSVNAAMALDVNYGAVKDIRICNNIFITKNNAALINVKKTLNLKFYNNVYFDNGNGFKFIDNGTSYNSLNIWRSVSGQEIYNGKFTGIKADPLLLNAGGGKSIAGVDSLMTLKAYRLNNISPIIGKGIVIDTLIGFKDLVTDFFGDSIRSNNQYTPGVHEIDAPKAQFSIGNSCKGSISKFINRSLKSDIYFWQFGDGTTSTAFSPTHLYNLSGTYNITLTVSGKFGYIDSIKKTVQIYDIPSAAFAVTGNKCMDNILSFKSADSAGVSYLWRFDDSTTDNKPLSNHSFKHTGSHQVKLITTISYCKDSTSKVIDIFNNPVTYFSIKNYCQGDSKLFSSLGSGDSIYQWDFGDSTFSNKENIGHIYKYPGSHLAKLIVGSNRACFDTFSQAVEIYNKPTAFFKTKNHCLGEQIPLENTSINDSLHLWDFGEGTSSNLHTPAIVATKSGKVIISLTAISKNSCKDTIEIPVDIYDLPSAGFTYTRITDSFYLKAKDTTLASYQWTINNSLLGSNLYKTTIQFTGKGLQTVTLKTINSNTCSDSSSQTIQYTPSGFEGLYALSNIILFPNPFSDRFTVHTGPFSEEIISMKITDMQGREIYNFTIPENTTFIFDSGNYPLEKGIYHLILSTTDNSVIKKIIKN